MDSDTMTSPGQFQKIFEEFGAGEIDILLGTQMVAKGLDFPRVSLVGVVSADTSLTLPDFRAAESDVPTGGAGGGAGRARADGRRGRRPDAARRRAGHPVRGHARLPGLCRVGIAASERNEIPAVFPHGEDDRPP